MICDGVSFRLACFVYFDFYLMFVIWHVFCVFTVFDLHVVPLTK